MRMKYAILLVVGAGLAGCAPRAADPDCMVTETLVEMDGEVVVMIFDCGERTMRTRPASAADLARLEAPL